MYLKHVQSFSIFFGWAILFPSRWGIWLLSSIHHCLMNLTSMQPRSPSSLSFAVTAEPFCQFPSPKTKQKQKIILVYLCCPDWITNFKGLRIMLVVMSSVGKEHLVVCPSSHWLQDHQTVYCLHDLVLSYLPELLMPCHPSILLMPQCLNFFYSLSLETASVVEAFNSSHRTLFVKNIFPNQAFFPSRLSSSSSSMHFADLFHSAIHLLTWYSLSTWLTVGSFEVFYSESCCRLHTTSTHSVVNIAVIGMMIRSLSSSPSVVFVGSILYNIF